MIDYQNPVKRNIWKAIAILTIIILLMITLFVVYSFVYNKSYQAGYNQGQLNLIVQINDKAEIPIILYNNVTGNSTIKAIPIKEICGK